MEENYQQFQDYQYLVLLNISGTPCREYGYLFSRNVFALDTFFPIADAFHEKYDPEGST
jgi:hypothetical protein